MNHCILYIRHTFDLIVSGHLTRVMVKTTKINLKHAKMEYKI